MHLLLLCLVIFFIPRTLSAGNGHDTTSPEIHASNEFDWMSYLISTQDSLLTPQSNNLDHAQPISQSSSHQKEQQSISHTPLVTGTSFPEESKKSQQRKKPKPYSWPKEKAKIERMTPEQKRFRKIYSRSRQQKYSNRIREQTGFSSLHNARLHEYRTLEQKGQATEKQLKYLQEQREKAHKHQREFQARLSAKILPSRNKD